MGNQIQTSSRLSFLENLSEPISVQDRDGSVLQVYRNKQISTQYFVRFSSAYGQQRSEEHLHFLQRLRLSDHPNLAKLFYFHLTEAQLVCNRQLRLDSYYAFYNFRLADVVARRYVSNACVSFRQEELWYIAGSILAVLKQLQREDLPIGGFTSNDFYLTPSGELKYYPHHLRKDYSHVGFLKVVRDPNSLHDYYLAPEQLKAVRTACYHQQDSYKSLSLGDVYSLGMVLLECLNLESSSRYYSLRMLEVKSQKLALKLKNVLPTEVVAFVRRCLEPEPSLRLTIAEVTKILANYQQSSSINFMGEQETFKEVVTPRPVRESTISATTNTSHLRLRSR